LNRERQANKIFVLLLRLTFTAFQNPNLARAVGLDDGFPLIGYRAIAKNLELTADNAEDIAEIVIEADEHSLNVDSGTMRRIREFTDQVDDITERAVEAAVERDFDTTIEVRETFADIEDREQEILEDLPEMDNDRLLQVREVLVSLQQTAQYAVRNAEIATNLSLNEESDRIAIS
ncbi:MAG: histidine kinase, partial [Halobacteriales archaeon SW_9_67_25]